jgi:hypothetical protein
MISANLSLQLYWLHADIPEPELPDPEPSDDGTAPPPTRDDPVDDPMP